MNLLSSLRAITTAESDGPVDWETVGLAAKNATTPGELELSADEIAGYREDVAAARTAIESVTTIDVSLPGTLEVQNRHHWIDANVATFRRVMEPLAQRGPRVTPGAAVVLNTASMSTALAFLARNVLGQYDPVLLAEQPDHGLYFVHPNIVSVARELDLDEDRFRRWIAFHEVTHAAEFAAAPWLPAVLESHLTDGVDALARGRLDRDAFRSMDATMTAVEGYAELLMDEAFDADSAQLREKLDKRRRGGGPLTKLIRRLFGLDIKRRQYERGSQFFATVAEHRGIPAAGAVWKREENLPTWDEFDDPEAWIARVNP